jgi:transglutaminase-like putative cysteine protease
MRYEVIHRTTYAYADEVSVSHHVARLTPRTLPIQNCLAHELKIEPGAALTSHREDYFGNRTTFFTVAGPHRALTVVARNLVEVLPRTAPEASSTPPWETVRIVAKEAGTIPAQEEEFVFASPLAPRLPALADYSTSSFTAGRPILEAVMDLTQRIHRDFQFDATATTVATPMEQVLKTRRGVCQDFAHFEVSCLRAIGLPARYVSGYLETLPPPGTPKLAGADASHAWVQVYIPTNGWVDVDPTNNQLVNDRYVTLAWGRDFDDVSPIRGVIVGGGKHQVSVGVDVVARSETGAP